MLTLRTVSYTLPGGRELFADVEMQLDEGDVIVVTGPSGSGKSTLLALAGGLLAPTRGDVQLDVAHAAPFAWVLQSTNALGSRSVLANAMLGNVIDGRPRRVVARAAGAVLEELGLGDLIDATARQLSGGELQRLAVARALVSARPLVLADEPTSQLDRANAEQVMAALCRPVEGRASVIVTHDIAAIPAGAQSFRLTEHGLVPT